MSEQKFVRFPGLKFSSGGEREIAHPVSGVRIESNEDIQEIFEFFSEPRTLAALDEAYGIGADDIAPFVDRLMIVDAEEVELLGRGFLRHEGPSIGEGADWHEVLEQAAEGDRVIIGAPVDLVAGGEGGARHGPREVRHAVPRWARGPLPERVLHLDLERAFELEGRACFDAGDAVFHADEPYATFGRRVRRAVDTALDRDLFPILIGGDHSVSWFALEAVLDRHDAVGVLHIDAHSDLDVDAPPDEIRLRHNNIFDFVCRHRSLAHLVQVGLRSSEAPRPGAIPVEAPVRVISARRARKMTPEEMFAGLPTDIPWYLSFDIDALAPEIAPETGTQLVGGLGFYDALELVDYATRALPLIGADFVEVAASNQRINGAAHAAGELLSLVLLGGTRSAPLTGHYFRPDS